MSTRSFAVLAAVVAIALIASVATAEPKKPKVRRVNNLKVVDANGKKVGYARGCNLDYEELFKPWVALKIGKYTVALRIERNLLWGTAHMVFDGVGCSGQAYVTGWLDNLDLLPRAVIRSPGSTVYIGDPNDSVHLVSTKSYERRDGSCTDRWAGYYAHRAVPLVDLDTLYTPPFSMR